MHPPLLHARVRVARFTWTLEVGGGGNEENGGRFGDGYREVRWIRMLYSIVAHPVLPLSFRGPVDRFRVARSSSAKQQRGVGLQQQCQRKTWGAAAAFCAGERPFSLGERARHGSPRSLLFNGDRKTCQSLLLGAV